MQRSLSLLFLLATVAPVLALGATASPSPGSSILPSPAPATSQCANLTAAPDGTLHLTYSAPSPTGGVRALFLSSLAPGATAFSAPRVIVSTPLLMENWADFASLAVGTDGALTAQWFQSNDSGGRHSYAGWFARSTDVGATWTAPAPLGHEFVALAPLSAGRTLAVWLESTRKHAAHDTPRPKRSAPSSDSQLPPGPSSPAMKLMARLLAPDGATLGEWTVDPDVCTCCQNTVAVLPGDRVFAAYRGHTPDEIRDNKFALFDLATRAWSTPATLRDDGWKIPACPVNGPAADSRGPALAVAWFTAADNTPRIHATYSANSARTFTAPVTIDLGRPMGRIETVMLADQTALLVWLESKTDTTSAGLYARRLWPDGKLSAAHLIADSTQARASGFPRAALRPNGHVVVSFTQPGEINQVRLLSLDPATFPRPTTLSAKSPRTLNSLPSTLNSSPTPLEFCIAPTLASH